MRLRIAFEDFFGLPSNLSNDDKKFAQRPGLKTGMDFRGQVWERVEKLHFLVWNRVRILGTRRHTSAKNSQEYSRDLSGTNTSVSETEAKASPAC